MNMYYIMKQEKVSIEGKLILKLLVIVFQIWERLEMWFKLNLGNEVRE